MPDLFEIMRTTRSMRRLARSRSRRAYPAGLGSWHLRREWRQHVVCRFLVVQDPKVKQTVGALYKRAWDEQVGLRYRSGSPSPGMSRDKFERMLDSVQYLADHFHEAPVWIVPCGPAATNARTSGSSIYPAVQNMLLAARAVGLGATLTTIHTIFAEEADAAFGLPEGNQSYAILPMGYPMANFGPVRRTSLTEVVYGSRWGATWAAAT